MLEVYKQLRYLSARNVITLNLLLATSVAISLDMAFFMAIDIWDGGIAVMEIIASWKFGIFIFATVFTILAIYLLLRYANRTEQDITLQNIGDRLENIEGKITKLDALVESINNLTNEIRNNRRKDG